MRTVGIVCLVVFGAAFVFCAIVCVVAAWRGLHRPPCTTATFSPATEAAIAQSLEVATRRHSEHIEAEIARFYACADSYEWDKEKS